MGLGRPQAQIQTGPNPAKPTRRSMARWRDPASTTMPPPTAADAFLVLEHLIGNRHVPHAVFAALLAALPSVSPHASPRMRKGVALRALDLALSDADADAVLRDARTVLADPGLASCFPDNRLALCDDVAALRRLVDAEWAGLPPSALEVHADRIVGSQTWADAGHDTRRKLRQLVGESMEREILGKLGEDPSTDPQVDKAANAPSTSDNGADGAHQVDKATNAPSTSGANEADRAQQDGEAHLGRGNGKASHVEEDCARHQQQPIERTTDARLPEKPVTASAAIKGKDKASSSRVTGDISPGPGRDKSGPVTTGSKPSLMEKNPTASVYEWGDSDDSEAAKPPRKRQLPTYEKPRPPPKFAHKPRKKWSEIQEKTLIEGVEKYGKGNWKDIKIAYPDVFIDRSTVDMKDKFRNMERYHIS